MFNVYRNTENDKLLEPASRSSVPSALNPSRGPALLAVLIDVEGRFSSRELFGCPAFAFPKGALHPAKMLPPLPCFREHALFHGSHRFSSCAFHSA